MTKEKTKPEDGAQPAADGQPDNAAKKPGLMKKLMPMVIFGIGGLVLVGGAIYVTLMFVGGEPAAQAGADHPDSTAVTSGQVDSTKHHQHADKTDSTDDLVASDDALSAAADSAEAAAALTRNIAAMTEAMDDHYAAQMESGNAEQLTKDESLKAVDWLESEKKKLTDREKELTSRETELQKKDREIAQGLLKIEQFKSDQVTNLAKLYDGMEADAVSKILANLDDDLVVAIIPRLKQKNASAILALMPPQRAASLSKQIITLASE